MGMTVLITGANGFVGTNIVHALAADPAFSIVATDMQDMLVRPVDFDAGSLTYLEGDVSSKEFNDNLRRDFSFDGIIHLAAVLSQAEDMKTYFSVMQSNIYTTFLLLETAREHKARFFFPSTAMVYGSNKAPYSEDMQTDPQNFYALSKRISEELILFYARKYGIGYVIFRLGVLYGTWQNEGMFIPSCVSSLVKGKEFPMTGGDQARDIVFIDDFVDLLRIALGKRDISGTYNVGSGAAPTMKEVALEIEKLTGAHNKIKPGALPYRDNELWNYRLDNKKACRTFNWQPRTNLTEGLKKTITHYRQATGR
ncbi:MAG: NAD-dependent epimerase/dehydratase family protein [Chitinivibrionales bacterium]|nr:NAD-dependent epimerase/dehydratase family protein [Chitinivibrionales bacterium]MBD3396823.1 NAD-dependent epimerase/dehydratase family protein [Chitinivibrionales bacterium]